MNAFVYFALFTLVRCVSRENNNNTFCNEKYNLNPFYKYKRCLDNIENIHLNTAILEHNNENSDYYQNSNSCDSSEVFDDVNYWPRRVWNSLILHHDLPYSHWVQFKSVFDKVYENQQHEMAALLQWKDNLKLVAEHNRRYLAGELSYSLHLNLFGDWDPEKYFKKILKLFDTIPLFDPSHDRRSSIYHQHIAHTSTPREVDWRAKGFKPKREEQWQCGACYAFAVTHALQAQLYKKHGDWGELSPQQIVDCSGIDGNLGCDGGSLRATFRYVSRTGLISERIYPYTGKKGYCKYSFLFAGTKPRSWAMLPAGDEEAMEKALATIGPLAVAVNASPFTFQLYRSGIYDDPFCVPWGLNHAMLLVGYTPQYWILLNWWGKKWGEDGYIRIRRGFNRCGVANMATYVTL